MLDLLNRSIIFFICFVDLTGDKIPFIVGGVGDNIVTMFSFALLQVHIGMTSMSVNLLSLKY